MNCLPPSQLINHTVPVPTFNSEFAFLPVDLSPHIILIGNIVCTSVCEDEPNKTVIHLIDRTEITVDYDPFQICKRIWDAIKIYKNL